MIYPQQFPVYKDNEYERDVHQALAKLMNLETPESDDFDDFCFSKSSGNVKGLILCVKESEIASLSNLKIQLC